MEQRISPSRGSRGELQWMWWYLGHTLLPAFLPRLNPCPLHLPPASGGLLVVLGLWQGPSAQFSVSYGQPRHLFFSLTSSSPGSREPVWSSLPCPKSDCFQLFAERVQRGWREMMGAAPHPRLLTFALSVMCECMESWDRSGESTFSPTSRLWAAYVWGSSLQLCSHCLSRCQNSVLLQGLNFWKPNKMCLLWVGSKASGCRSLPVVGVPLPSC